MSAEERTLTAIRITREALRQSLSDPEALVQMTIWDIGPEAIENTITEILEYLEKTAMPEEAEG